MNKNEKFDLEKKFILNSKMLFREEGDEMLAFNPETDECFVINKTGNEIIKLLDGKNSVGKILENISKKYDDNKEKIRKDIIVYINNLCKEGVVVESKK